MIEVPEFPPVWRMAGRAVLAQTSVMRIILFVTADAFLERFFKALCGVALSAGHRDVQAEERETRKIVIEAHVFPLGDSVTLRAVLPQGPAVRLVRPVAAQAVLAELLL